MSTIQPLPTTQDARPLTVLENAAVTTGAKMWTAVFIYPLQMLKVLVQSQATEAGTLKRIEAKWFNPFFIYEGLFLYFLNAPLVGAMGAVETKSREYLSHKLQRELTTLEKLQTAIFAASLGVAPWTALDLILLRHKWHNGKYTYPKLEAKELVQRFLKGDAGAVRNLLGDYWQERRVISAKKISIFDATKEIFRKGGYKGFLRGACGTAGREIPFLATIFTLGPALEVHVKKELPQWLSKENRDWIAKVIAGILAGTGTTFLTMPADVVKTSMQKYDPIEFPQYATVRSTLKAVWEIGTAKALKAYCDPSVKPYGLFRFLPKNMSADRVKLVGGCQHYMVGFGWRSAVVSTAVITMTHMRQFLSDRVRDARP